MHQKNSETVDTHRRNDSQTYTEMAHQTTQSNNYSTTAAAASSSSWPASTIPTATPTNYYSVQTEESRMSSQQRHAQDHEATTAQAELLDYYRERCAEYDRERQRLLERFNNLEVRCNVFILCFVLHRKIPICLVS